MMINPNENMFVDLMIKESFLEYKKKDLFAKSFPSELIINIFSRLHFKSLLILAEVNKRFSALTDDPILLKVAIYRDMTFNPLNWKSRFGKESQGALDHELAFKLFPDYIGAVFKGACPLNPQKKLGETHVIVWKPAILSLNNYVKLVKEKTKFSIEITAPNDEFGKLTEKGEWVVMSRKSYRSDSEGLNFKDLLLPTALEATLCSSAIYMKFKNRIFGELEATKCQEMKADNSLPICVQFHFKLLIGGGHYNCIAPVFKF